MIIKKDSEEAKLIAKLAEHSYTANVDTVVSSVFFGKHSIQFNCTKNIFDIELKIETGLDNDYVIDNKEFIEYLKGVCSLRMTFEHPNEDLQSCLNFIDTTFDDLLIRIKDLEKINN